MGSPGYLAPERFEGTPASPSSDVYSVGVLLYETLAGGRPIQGDHSWAVAAARKGNVTPLLERRPEAGPALSQIVERAMSPDPADRFASAEEMADAIKRSAHATVPLPPTVDQAATTAALGDASDDAEATPAEPTPTDRLPARATRAARTEEGPSVRSIVTAMVVGAVVLLILLAVAFVIAGGPGESSGANPEIPPPLADALDRLEESIP